jgi:hypothetical protein
MWVLARTLRILGLAVVAHGTVFAMCNVTLARIEAPALEAIGAIYFFVVVAPALILAMPFSPLLWHFHLMETPGWFAWPKPSGFVLVYSAWFVALFAASLLARPRRRG